MKKAVKAVKAVIVITALAAFFASIFYFFESSWTYKTRDTDRESKPVRLLFAGDMMFDRTIRKIAEDKGYDYLFSCLSDYLKGFDMIVANLEGSVTNFASISRNTTPGEPGNTTFTFDKRIAEVLFSHRIGILNLGNNHIMDFGRVGLDETKKTLDDAGLLFFGAPGDVIYATTSIRSRNLAVVNFNQFVSGADAGDTMRAIWQVKKDADLVVVYAHWGEEYVPVTEYQRALAHSFIDAGADIVIGSHPHIIQESEIYRKKSIHYSLGNFIFDQYWNDQVSTGRGVEVILDSDKIEQKQVFFDIDRNGLTCLL